jgi:CheY-like chemotaxis protein
MAVRQVEILLAEDNPVDVQILQRCLRDVTFPYHLRVVDDGEAALAFLQQQDPYTEAPRPDLILLDIYLLKKSGWEILEWLRVTPYSTTIPVVMLSGILAPFDEQERDRLHPTRCLVKPTTIEEFRDLTAILEEVMSQNAPVV